MQFETNLLTDPSQWDGNIKKSQRGRIGKEHLNMGKKLKVSVVKSYTLAYTFLP